MTTIVFSRCLRIRSARALAACAAAFLMTGAAHAQITYGWEYDDTGGFGDSTYNNAPSRGLWSGGAPSGCNGCTPPSVAETWVATANGGSAVAGVDAEKPEMGPNSPGSSEVWIDYTLSIPAPTTNWVTLVMNTTEHVTSFYDGIAAVLVSLKPYAAVPSDFQDLDLTNPSSDDWEQGLVTQDGVITDFEWPDFNPFNIDEPKPIVTTSAGTSASKDETVDFEVVTNKTYTIRVAAYAASSPSCCTLDQMSPYLPAADAVWAVASFDPTFSLVGGPAGAKIVGLPPDALAGYTTPTNAVPEASTWAMLVIGFIGFGFAGARRRLYKWGITIGASRIRQSKLKTKWLYLTALACAASATAPAKANETFGWLYVASDYCANPFQGGAAACAGDANKPVSGWSVTGAPPAYVVGGGGATTGVAQPAVAANATSAGGGAAAAAFESEYPYPGEGGGEADVAFTFSVASAKYSQVRIALGARESVTSLYDGIAGVVVDYVQGAENAGDAIINELGYLPYHYEDIQNSVDWGSESIVAHNGVITRHGYGFSDLDYVTSGTSDTETVQPTFYLNTNTTYTFILEAFAEANGNSGEPNLGASYLTASIDPTFTIDLSVDPGAKLSDFSFVGLPDPVNGDLAPATGAAPEASTWAMLVIGFIGLGFVRHRRTRIVPSAASSPGDKPRSPRKRDYDRYFSVAVILRLDFELPQSGKKHIGVIQ